MPAQQIAPGIYSVGAIDYDVRDFHGYKTPYGTTYNAYLVMDEKITLIDTVKRNMTAELLANISEIVDPSKIDYFISNHSEPDHSGAMPEIMALNPGKPVFCAPNGLKDLKAYYKEDWNFRVVKSGESLSLGKYSLSFVHTSMVHWPDSMVSFMPETGILFSNDAFGQHIATAERFADEVGYDKVYDRAANYYANIVMPFGAPVMRVLADASKLDIKMIAPSHGVIWREGLDGILSRYTRWAQYETRDDLAVIAYDTMWKSTGILADRLADELRAQGKEVKVMSLREYDYSEVVAEALEADTIYIGSATLNRSIMPMVAALLSYMKGLGFKNRKGRAFGSYGWSGESTAHIDAALKDMGFETIEPLRVQYVPD